MSLCVSTSLQHNAEERMRTQFNTKEWYQLRAHRITSSTCCLILNQRNKTLPLLHWCLYPKPLLNPLPSSVAWGQQNEKVACKKYTEFMVRSGHSGLTTQPCGFIIHQTKGWLGVSPDAKVFDPACSCLNGIAEFKCPYTKRDKSPEEACSDPSFYCELVNGHFHLKRTHQYYHQVQLQLYVSSDMSSWCDFCVYTPVDVAVERIYPCKEWQSTFIPELEDYYDRHMLPRTTPTKSLAGRPV